MRLKHARGDLLDFSQIADSSDKGWVCDANMFFKKASSMHARIHASPVGRSLLWRDGQRTETCIPYSHSCCSGSLAETACISEGTFWST